MNGLSIDPRTTFIRHLAVRKVCLNIYFIDASLTAITILASRRSELSKTFIGTTRQHCKAIDIHPALNLDAQYYHHYQIKY